MSGSEAPALRRRAMDLLARREHSRRELAAKLRIRFAEAEPTEIDSVLDRLAAENLQSDQRFAEEYLRLRMRRGYGWLHIRAELRARGIEEEIIAGLSRPEEEWLALAENLAVAKLRNQPRPSSGGKEHRRLFRFLQTRGFSPEVVHKALRKLTRTND